MRDNLYLGPDTLRGAEGLIIGAFSGLITGVAANADLFGLRNIGPRRLAITAIRLRFVPRTAFTTAQAVAFRVHKVYAFTGVHSGGSGTAVQAHYRSALVGGGVGDLVPLTEISAIIAGTAAITSGTYTAATATEPELVGVGAAATLPGLYEDWSPIDGLPITLAPDTGIVVKNVVAMGAAGVGNLFVGFDGFRVD